MSDLLMTVDQPSRGLFCALILEDTEETFFRTEEILGPIGERWEPATVRIGIAGSPYRWDRNCYLVDTEEDAIALKLAFDGELHIFKNS